MAGYMGTIVKVGSETADEKLPYHTFVTIKILVSRSRIPEITQKKVEKFKETLGKKVSFFIH